eukprot:GFUD01011642.1.p1 GENE.GFUD01011642.1~~GFUD01011642.1.p1  ORF type:complete len:104 (-),score=33.94 GFUD01011642.1:125-436(-)
MSVVSGVAKQILPLFDRIVVQRAVAETKSRGGIIIPEQAQNRGKEATVVAVGPGMRDGTGSFIPMSVAVGDKVLLPDYSGSKLELEGEELSIFREGDIVAKLN